VAPSNGEDVVAEVGGRPLDVTETGPGRSVPVPSSSGTRPPGWWSGRRLEAGWDGRRIDARAWVVSDARSDAVERGHGALLGLPGQVFPASIETLKLVCQVQS
jgi:hypothetical protein